MNDRDKLRKDRAPQREKKPAIGSTTPPKRNP